MFASARRNDETSIGELPRLEPTAPRAVSTPMSKSSAQIAVFRNSPRPDCILIGLKAVNCRIAQRKERNAHSIHRARRVLHSALEKSMLDGLTVYSTDSIHLIQKYLVPSRPNQYALPVREAERIVALTPAFHWLAQHSSPKKVTRGVMLFD